MAKEWAIKFYKSTKWLKCRSSYISYRISVDGGLCEACKERLGKIVHHTILLTPNNINNPEVSLNHEYLRYECKKCHDRNEGHFKPRTKVTIDGLKFNEFGELVKE
ncbi:MAG: hypothetical protein KH415_20655 [Clostridium sp.]|nr:hypothetical protein [Clostridium sp.]